MTILNKVTAQIKQVVAQSTRLCPSQAKPVILGYQSKFKYINVTPGYIKKTGDW